MGSYRAVARRSPVGAHWSNRKGCCSLRSRGKGFYRSEGRDRSYDDYAMECGVIKLFPFAVVSLWFGVSVLTAPVTHQDQGLQKNELSSSAAPSVLNGPENLRFQAVSKSWVTDLMVVSQPLVAHGVGGQDGDDLVGWGWNGRPIRSRGFSPTPMCGSPFQPAPYPNNLSGLKGT